jgi:DNA-binding CsgD family transcriptional regulator
MLSSAATGNSVTSLSSLSRLIGHVYDSILEPEGWKLTLAEFCQLIDAKAASIHTFNPMNKSVGLYIEHGTNAEFTPSLMSTYAAMVPTGASMFLADVGEPMGFFDYIDEDEFRESRFYREWCVPQGYYDMLGALISKQANEIGALTAARSESQPRFDAQARELLGLIAPHVRRAVKISGLLENRVREIEQLSSTIDQLGSAVIIVSATGAILRANELGRAVLADGSVLKSVQGALVVADDGVRNVVKAAFESDVLQPAMCAVSSAGGGHKILAIMPLDAGRHEFALFLKTEEPEIPAIGRHLSSAFNLTPREVSVLLPLLEGLSPTEVSERLGIAVATVRTHLHSLFVKTGTSSQVELVSLILTAMPPVKFR